MTGSDDRRPEIEPPCCYKCKGRTIFYARVADPKSSKTYELYECQACGVLTSRVLDK